MKNLTDELLEAQAKLVNAQDHEEELKRQIEKMEESKASEEMDSLKAQLEETQAEARQLDEKCNALEEGRRKEKSYLEQLEKEVSKQRRLPMLQGSYRLKTLWRPRLPSVRTRIS